jgi:hypothetical protein
MPLVTYHPDLQMDMLLSKLYTDIIYARDGDKLLAPQAQTLSGFLALCQTPNVCVLGFDEGDAGVLNGPWLWAVFEPVFSGAFVSLWVRPEKRGSKQAARVTFELLTDALDACPLLLNITKQAALLPDHEKLGYRLVGQLPGLWGGADVWLLALDRAGVEAAKTRFAGLWKGPPPPPADPTPQPMLGEGGSDGQ